MRRSLLVSAALILVQAVASERAHAHLDIVAFQKNGALRLGAFDFGSSAILESELVFTSELETLPEFPGGAFSDDPGWNSVRDNFPFLPEGVTTLPGDRALEFDFAPTIVSGNNLGYWDGNDDVVFGAVPDGEVVRYANSFDLTTAAIADGSSNVISGFPIGVTSPSGYLHRHLSFTLFGNAGLNGGSDDGPRQGVYLVAFVARVEGLPESSNPVFILLGNGVSPEQLAEAAAEVRRLAVHCEQDDGDVAQPSPSEHADILLSHSNGALQVEGAFHAGNLRENDAAGNGSVWATVNPGFAGSGFQFQDEILFDITGPLRRWNGANWSAANICHERIEFLEPGPFGEPLNLVGIDSATRFAEGFRIAQAGTRGAIHNHYTFALRATDGVAPRLGAYAFPMVLRSPQYAAAREIHLVFNNGLSVSEFSEAMTRYQLAASMRMGIARSGPEEATLSLQTLDRMMYQIEGAPAVSGPWEQIQSRFEGGPLPFQTTVALDGAHSFFRARRVELENNPSTASANTK